MATRSSFVLPAGFLALVATGFVLGWSGRVFASRDATLDLDALTRRAAVVVEGRVVDVRSEWTPGGGQIRSTAVLEVRVWHKGGMGGNRLEVAYLGGTVGDVTFAILEQPALAAGEDVLLFLSANWSRGEMPFVGNAQGKFMLARDPATGREVALGARLRLDKQDLTSGVARTLAPLRAAGVQP